MPPPSGGGGGGTPATPAGAGAGSKGLQALRIFTRHRLFSITDELSALLAGARASIRNVPAATWATIFALFGELRNLLALMRLTLARGVGKITSPAGRARPAIRSKL